MRMLTRLCASGMRQCCKLSLWKPRLLAPGAVLEGLGKRNSLGSLNQDKFSLELLVSILLKDGNVNESKREEGKVEAPRHIPEDFL